MCVSVCTWECFSLIKGRAVWIAKYIRSRSNFVCINCYVFLSDESLTLCSHDLLIIY